MLEFVMRSWQWYQMKMHVIVEQFADFFFTKIKNQNIHQFKIISKKYLQKHL